MQPRSHPLAAEQHDAEEAGLEEERRQHLIAHQRANDGAGLVAKPDQLVPNW